MLAKVAWDFTVQWGVYLQKGTRRIRCLWPKMERILDLKSSNLGSNFRSTTY